ncbi:MAG: insulinase family protein [Ignavibacteria bacterium]
MAVSFNILTNGKTSRLYKKLIDANKAIGVFTWYNTFKDAGLFPIYSNLTGGTTHEEVEKIILDEIENIKTNGVTEEEVERAINKIVAQTTFGRDGSFSIAAQINEAIAIGDWTSYVTYLDNIKKVTPASVKKVVENYLVENKSVTGYFIPENAGSDESSKSASMLYGSHDKLFYRSGNEIIELLNTPDEVPEVNPSINSTEINRKNINGIDVISVKTGVKDVVTFSGSFVAGDYYSPESNCSIADLTARMLDKGTTKNDKFVLAEKLENIGATLSFGTGKHTVTFNGKCLKKDLETVIGLLSEQLRYPAFDEKEFEKLKTRVSNSLKQLLENTNIRADVELDRLIFPEGHPNHVPSVQKLIDDIEKANLQEVKDFYKKYYGPKSMIFVAVGDLEEGALNKSIKRSFDGWSGGFESQNFDIAKPQTKGTKHIITIPDKASVTLLIGQTSTLKKSDEDYLPLHIGISILGGNFSARLMSIIRDDEGLTYGISSWHTDDIYSDERWQVRGAFNPSLLNKGYESTMRELKRWVDEGVTDQELKDRKSTLIGSFKVELATTGGIAGQVLSFVQRGFDPEYIYEYPKEIEKVTLSQVNEAINKYIKYEDLVTVMAGSVDENGNPLK